MPGFCSIFNKEIKQMDNQKNKTVDRNLTIEKCSYCDTRFVIDNSQHNQRCRKSGNIYYCSEFCFKMVERHGELKDKRTHINVEQCANCFEPIAIPENKNTVRWGSSYFCSDKCMNDVIGNVNNRNRKNNTKEHTMAKPSNNVVENIQQIVNDKPGITSRELLDTYKNDWRDFNHDTDPFDPLVDLDYMCDNELLQNIKYTYTIDGQEYEVMAYFPASTEFHIW